MTTSREKLEDLIRKRHELDAQCESIYGKQSDIIEQKEKIIREIILEEKLLANTSWHVITQHNHQTSIELQSFDNDDVMCVIAGLCFISWHDSFQLENGVSLRTDDGSTRLFVANELVLDVIRRYNLIIDTKSIEIQMTYLTQKIDVLKELLFSVTEKE